MRKAWLVLPFLLIPAAVAAGGAARRSPSPSSSAAGPDVFLGYSYTHDPATWPTHYLDDSSDPLPLITG